MVPPPLVQLANIAVTFGGRPLFEGVDLSLARGDRVCLVGRNGAGKSTLMRLIAGEAQPDFGTRYVEPGVRISYLSQSPDLSGHARAIDHVTAGLPHDLADETHRAERALDLMAVEPDRDPSSLSGGEARRLDLARALASEPDVLLLDEPTNHLDVITIERLEAVLASWRGALMIISHDRAFLKGLSNRSLWLDRGHLKTCPYGFDRFEVWADEEIAREEAERHKLDRRIEAETDWARRGIPARRKRNQGRLRALEAMRAERRRQRERQGVAKLEIVEADRGATVVVEAAGAAASVAGREILRDVTLKIRRGDRIGVVGPNGAGKTTLLRLLIGEIGPDRGTVRMADGIELAYFDQRRESLDPDRTLKDVLLPEGGDTVRVGDRSRHISGYLSDFLFEPGQMLAQVKSLSGGERNRLLLARLFARPSNLLVLDEPTNDLDMETLDLLQEVLGDYAGTVIAVSHDRDFLDRIATSIVAVEGDGKATEYVGGWSDFRRQRPASPEVQRPRVAPPAKATAQPRNKRKLSYKEARALAELPSRIETLEAEIASLHALLADPDLFARDPARVEAAGLRLADAEREKALAEDRWLELAAAEEELARS